MHVINCRLDSGFLRSMPSFSLSVDMSGCCSHACQVAVPLENEVTGPLIGWAFVPPAIESTLLPVVFPGAGSSRSGWQWNGISEEAKV